MSFARRVPLDGLFAELLAQRGALVDRGKLVKALDGELWSWSCSNCSQGRTASCSTRRSGTRCPTQRGSLGTAPRCALQIRVAPPFSTSPRKRAGAALQANAWGREAESSGVPARPAEPAQ